MTSDLSKTQGKVISELVRLALPLSFIQLSFHLTSLVDTAVAGRLGEIELAGVGLGSSTFFIASIFGMGVVLALDPVVSQAIGAGREQDARHALRQGLYLAGFLSLPMGLVAVGIAENLSVVGVVPEVAEEARVYVWGRLLHICFLYGVVALRSYLQAVHRIRPIVLSAVLANCLNLALDWALAFGTEGMWGEGSGFAGLGSVGIAWASTLTGLFQMAILLFALRARSDDEKWPEVSSIDWKMLRMLVRVGTPIGTQLLAEIGVFTLVHVLISTFSSTAAAGHQTALALASMTFSACLGIGAATSVQVGREIGGGNFREARIAGLGGMGVAVCFMLLPSVLMLSFPEFLCGLIATSPEVIESGAQFLRIAAVFQIVDGVQSVASGALRGAGATRWPMMAHLVSHWGIGLPVGLVLAFGFGFGALGLWWGLTVGLGAAAVSLSWKFSHLSRGSLSSLSVR